MEKILPFMEIIRNNALFARMEDDDIRAALDCLGAEVRTTEKGQILLLTGDKPLHVGIVLSGRLRIVREGAEGNVSVITTAVPGDIYAETLCCANVAESPVTVIAESESVILMLPFQRITRTCQNGCAYHARLIENMLAVVAAKCLYLQGRAEHLSLGTIRARVSRYLSSLKAVPGKKIRIPFDREGMAGYLGVERTALSHELARMKRDGLIDYRKNEFVIKKRLS